jgi:hypothetical protein
MATEQLNEAPDKFLDTLEWSAPPAGDATPIAPTPRRRHHTGWLFASAGVVIVAAGALVVSALAPRPAPPPATVAAFQTVQKASDMLDDDDVANLVVRPESTRLLVSTPDGDHYAALSASGDLCLLRVPKGDVPSEVCVPDRVGADVTIGGDGNGGQVRLVADGAPQPSAAEGWRSAGPNVWVKG